MTDRMGKLDRLLSLVHLLSDSGEGLTLDDMAGHLGVNRRTAERMRDIIALHFDLDEIAEERRKRFRIRDSLRRVYTRPTAAEVAAFQALVVAQRSVGGAQAEHLTSLLAKVKGALDDREKRRIDPDLEALARLQRTLVMAGPVARIASETIVNVQRAILTGRCVEFDYSAGDAQRPSWRRVVPFGLVHGPQSYLIGKIPGRDAAPVYFRLDRMNAVKPSELLDSPPDDWDIDAWLAGSFAIWRDEVRDVVLKVFAASAARARGWRFHPGQEIEDAEDGGVIVRFSTGGMRELADHLFSWAGELTIEGPQALIEMMRERLAVADSLLPPRPVR